MLKLLLVSCVIALWSCFYSCVSSNDMSSTADWKIAQSATASKDTVTSRRTPDNVGVYPYIVAVSEKHQGLRVSLPRQLDGSTCIMDAVDDDLVIGAAAEMTNRYVTGFDDLSVTLKMDYSSDSSISYALVRGSPFVSANYSHLAPRISSTHVFLSVNNLTSEGALETDTLRIALNNNQVITFSSCEIGRASCRERVL